MATEVEYVNYKDFVAGLESTEAPGVDDVTVVSNETDGPRAVPANTSALSNTATDSDLTAAASFELQTPTGKKKLRSDLLAQKVLAGNVAPVFDPNKPDDAGGYAYYAGTSVIYNGSNYVFTLNKKSGAWDPSYVEKKPLSESIQLEGIGEAVKEWLNEHPEATTTVEDSSLIEAKFSDDLKLKAIKDYVTPEMFGAKGDGVTNDTAALSEALTHKLVIFPPNKTYIVEPLDVERSGVIIYGNGSTLKAESVSQNYIVKLKQRNYWVEKINIVGGENATCDAIVLDAGEVTSANVNFKNINISNCGKAFYCKSYYWDSIIEKVRIDKCNYGFYNENEILSVKLDTVYFNQCKESLYLQYGCSSLYLINCEFGSVVPESRWIYVGNVVRTLHILGCSFEECKIATGSAPIDILSGSRIVFESCDFSVLTKVEEATDTSFLKTRTSDGTNTRIEFTHCRFKNNSGIDYCYNYSTGDQSIQIILDFESFSGLIGSLGRTSFNALGIYSSSILRLTIKDIPSFVTSLPNVSTFGTNAAVKNIFKGTLARLAKTASVYMFDGSSWVEFQSTLPADLTALAGRVTALENANQ